MSSYPIVHDDMVSYLSSNQFINMTMLLFKISFIPDIYDMIMEYFTEKHLPIFIAIKNIWFELKKNNHIIFLKIINSPNFLNQINQMFRFSATIGFFHKTTDRNNSNCIITGTFYCKKLSEIKTTTVEQIGIVYQNTIVSTESVPNDFDQYDNYDYLYPERRKKTKIAYQKFVNRPTRKSHKRRSKMKDPKFNSKELEYMIGIVEASNIEELKKLKESNKSQDNASNKSNNEDDEDDEYDDNVLTEYNQYLIDNWDDKYRDWFW